jgi:hypothetical protein
MQSIQPLERAHISAPRGHDELAVRQRRPFSTHSRLMPLDAQQQIRLDE